MPRDLESEACVKLDGGSVVFPHREDDVLVEEADDAPKKKLREPLSLMLLRDAQPGDVVDALVWTDKDITAKPSTNLALDNPAPSESKFLKKHPRSHRIPREQHGL